MLTSQNPPRENDIWNKICYESKDSILITLSYFENNHHWLEIDCRELQSSTCSSIIISSKKTNEIIKYLESVCGIVRAVRQMNKNENEKKKSLIKAAKFMSSISYFEYINASAMH